MVGEEIGKTPRAPAAHGNHHGAENFKNLARYKEIAGRLARPRA